MPTARSSSGSTVFTVAFVPTGMNAGVSTTPCAVRKTAARAGFLRTNHGEVPTPAFMPVGTKATVKTVDPEELRELGTTVLLGNTYHLHFRPGEDVIAELGRIRAHELEAPADPERDAALAERVYAWFETSALSR